MPDPSNPKLEPLTSPSSTAFRLQQQIRERTLRAALAKAKVSQSTADTVVQQDTANDSFRGYVQSVTTMPIPYLSTGLTTIVYVVGEMMLSGVHEFQFYYFPLNDPLYLPEFLRAMNHPHFTVHVSAQMNDSGFSIINGMVVETDYNYPPKWFTPASSR